MPRTRVWQVCLTLLGLVMAFSMAGPGVLARGAAAQAPAGKITLKGHTIPALKHLTSTGKTSGMQALQLSIALTPRNDAQLQTLLTQLNDRSSANYHHYLTSTQYAQAFGRTSSEVQAITSYLKSQGVHVTSVAPNNLLIDATTSVATAEQAFGVTIANYTLNGRAVYAPTNDPSLPASIGAMVSAIAGLDNVGVYQPHYEIAGRASSLKQRPNAGTGPYGGYAPSDLYAAYDMNSLLGGYSGTGSRIALYELDGYTLSDVTTYRSYFGLPNSPVNNILVDGATTNPTGTGGDIEVELDMEIASAITPNATQDIYIGPNGYGINDTYTRIATDNTDKVISTSWGLCETYSGTAELSALDGIFQQYAAQGQALFAAAGDAGAYDCGDTNLAVDSPASDPNVVGVGGTSLTTSTSQSYISETVWSDPTNTQFAMGVGGGGGTSSYFTMPAYQRGPNVINSYSTGAREVPDVTANADPYTGYAIYYGGSWYGGFGGTSAAAPLWASVAVDTNQYLAGLGKPTLGSASAMIYQIYNHPQPYAAYHDITSGNNLYYPAQSGYDMASGVGSPDVWNFARDAAAAVPNSLAKTWYFAEGYTGSGFTEYLTLANPNTATAHVQVTYLLGSGSPVVVSYTVNPTARLTVNVNNAVGANKNVSMVVSSDIGIIAERPMYFTFTGQGLNVPGGTDVLGATQLNTQFDFGYLDTTANHATYLTVLNQNSSAMTVSVSYYPQTGGSPTVIQHTVNANSRGTITVNNEGLAQGIYSAQVALSAPGLVERPMYLTDATTGYTGSADVIGVQQPSTTWDFAEGYTSPTFNERYILSNPNSSSTTATVTFLESNGTAVPVTVTINPGALQIVSANSALGSTGVNNSAVVTATQPIVAERFMSFTYTGKVGSGTSSIIPGATDVLGATQPGYWFGFAEGYTGGAFAEYLTLENPDPTNTAYVGITYLPANGAAPSVQVISIAPHSRYTINTNNVIAGQSFSVVVESGLPIVAERPMYFNYNGDTGGSDVVGYQLY